MQRQMNDRGTCLNTNQALFMKTGLICFNAPGLIRIATPAKQLSRDNIRFVMLSEVTCDLTTSLPVKMLLQKLHAVAV